MRKKINRGLAFLMSFIMLASSINLPVYAAGHDENDVSMTSGNEAETVTESDVETEEVQTSDEVMDASEDALPGFDEEVTAETDTTYAVATHATEVKMVNLSDPTGEPVTLNAENPSQDGAVFDAENGVLTLSKGVDMTDLPKLVLYKKTNNDSYYSAIFANGNLTVVIDSNEELIFCGKEESLDNKKVCGIYVTSNLTIKNAKDKTAKVTFKTLEGASEAYGMWAEKLILSESETGSLEVNSRTSDTSNASYGAEISGTITVGNEVHFSAEGGKSTQGSSYGISTGTLDLKKNSYTCAKSGDAKASEPYLSVGVNSQKIEFEDDTVILECCHGTGSTNAYCWNSITRKERTFDIAVRPQMGLYPYLVSGSGSEYVPGVIADHTEEVNWGINSSTLYGHLKNLSEPIKVSWPVGKKITYGDLCGEGFYNFTDEEGILAAHNVYAISNNDAEAIKAGNLSSRDVTRHTMDEVLPVTKNRDINLCFSPKVSSMSYKFNDKDFEMSGQAPKCLVSGHTLKLKYLPIPLCADTEIGFLAFDIDLDSMDDLTSPEALMTVLGNGADTDRIKLSYADGRLDITGADEGMVMMLPAPMSAIEEFENGEIDAPAFAKEAIFEDGVLLFNVEEGKTYTLDANGGVFLRNDQMEAVQNCRLDDIERLLNSGKEKLSFVAPKSCTWNEFLYEYMKPALDEQGYDPNKVFKLGCKLSGVVPAPTESELNNPIPQNLETFTVKYQDEEPVTMSFKSNGGTVTWPASAEGKYTATDDGYSYTDVKNTLFTFPEAHKDGYYFVGWKDGFGNVYSAGKTGTVVERDFTAVFENATVRFEGELPTELTTEMSVPHSTPEALTEGAQADATFFCTRLSPYSASVDVFESDERYYYMLPFSYETDVPAEDMKVFVGDEQLNVFLMYDNYFFAWKEYTIGDVSAPVISFDLGDKQDLLPDYAKDGIRFYPGALLCDTIGTKKTEQLESLSYTEDGKEYIVVWCWDKELEHPLEDGLYEEMLHNKTDSFTLYADWVLRKKLETVDIEVPIPSPGMVYSGWSWDGDGFSARSMRGSDDKLFWSAERICSDELLNDDLAENAVFEKGSNYYAEIRLDPNYLKGYYIDEYDLPTVSVNGIKARCMVKNLGGTNVYYAVFAFVPVKKTVDVTLQFNIPFGDPLSHTITGIPAGKTLYQGMFSLLDALQIRSMTYEEYLSLAEEYKNLGEEAFYAKYPKQSLDEVEKEGITYRAPDSENRYFIASKAKCENITELEADAERLHYGLTKDTVAYIQWKRFWDSVEVKEVTVPKCGQTEADYADPEDYHLTLKEEESFYPPYPIGWCDAEGNMLTSYSFKGGDTAYLYFTVCLTGKGEYFDRFLSDKTVLLYEGKEYKCISEEYGELGFVIPVTVEHVFDEEGGKSEKRNVVGATCEKSGSYDEYREYECKSCHKHIEEDLQRYEPALGHKLVKIEAKEATETENGCKLHWECERCHKCFADAYGKTEVSKESVIIPKTGEGEPEETEVTEETPSENEATISVNKITISENKVLLKIGGTKRLIPVIEPENVKEPELSWKSSNEEVVTVDKNGVITGIWCGTAKVTVTTANGKSAVCDVTVEKAFADDNAEHQKISPEDMDDYVVPKKQEHKLVTQEPVSVRLKDGNEVKISVSANYMNAVTYSGKLIRPYEDLAAEYELQDILDKAGVSGVDPKEIFKVRFASKNNKNAGKDSASFYGKISLVNGAKKKFNLSKEQEKNLKKILKAVNKEHKKNKISYTINKASLADLPEISLHAKLNNDGSLKLKNTKISGFKSVKVKYKADDRKAVKLSPRSGYSYEVTETETAKVKVIGNKNFTGYVTLTAEK